jgi:NAD(P)-dependent dehydrogenase (short-subunit alcohol dehydrogenase family)
MEQTHTHSAPSEHSRTWFVTGSSRGLGRALVRAALTADLKWREVSRSADFAEEFPVAFPPDPAEA